MTRLIAVAVLSTLVGTAALAADAKPDRKSVTHQLTLDEPWYADSPAQGRPPDGILKKGTRVSILGQAGNYSQVWTEDGSVKGYISTGSMKKIGKGKKGQGSQKAPEAEPMEKD
jgi:hypothetical protein